jgi:hypothetical protein
MDWLLMPVILATQEIRKITVRSQPGANSWRDPILKKPITKKAGRVVQGEGSEFKPNSSPNNNKKNEDSEVSVLCLNLIWVNR